MKLSKDGVFRGLILTLSFHVITWLAFGIIYYVPGLAEMALFLSFILGLIVIPVYFVQRGNAESGFSVTFLGSHALLCLVEFFVIRSFTDSVWDVLIAWSDGFGWETLGYSFTFFIILVAGLIPPAIDGLICIVRKWMKGREF